MSALAELFFVPATLEDRTELADRMEAGFKLIDGKSLVESRHSFIRFDKGGRCFACALGLSLIGMLGLEKVMQLAKAAGGTLFRENVVQLLGCGERLSIDVSRAHQNLGMSAGKIILALRAGRL